MTTAAPLSHIHRFVPGQGHPLLLLHGTGGNEDDLIPLGQAIGPGRPLLSPRGNILENGMPRFFRRLSEGVFDEDDVRLRANELADFIAAAREAYDLEAPIAVGFSNGANIATAILLLKPEALARAILLRAMVPLADPPEADLAGKRVLIVSGAADPIIPIENANRLADMLRRAKANVQHDTLPGGHGLSQGDLVIATKWLNAKDRSWN